MDKVLSDYMDGLVKDFLARIEESKQKRIELMPTEKEAIYCPKDGTVFSAIEAGSTGIFDCIYEGEWPDGAWWALEVGDMWPSHPILFKLKEG